MEQIVINLVKHMVSSGDLVQITPKTLQLGRNVFRDKDGNRRVIEVVKYKHL